MQAHQVAVAAWAMQWSGCQMPGPAVGGEIACLHGSIVHLLLLHCEITFTAHNTSWMSHWQADSWTLAVHPQRMGALI
jgi:hypothetical protein